MWGTDSQHRAHPVCGAMTLIPHDVVAIVTTADFREKMETPPSHKVAGPS